MLIKKNDIMPERPIILVLYGTAGAGKTSLACTSDNPLLIDTDRGFDRACFRVDTITASTWTDIFNTENMGGGTVKGVISDYKTIILDTAKACLDDFLQAYVIQQNYKLQTNSLKRFGEMANQFKNFVNLLRVNGSDIIFVCHDKETQEGDFIRHSPDCTGQSKDLLLRIADEVGYVCKENGRRVIKFEPTDTRVGKNVAQLPDTVIPEYGDKNFDSFMSNVILKVKNNIANKSDAQAKAQANLDEARAMLADVDSLESANDLINISNSLAKVHQKGFKTLMISELKKKGYVFDKKTEKFVSDETADKGNAA